MNTKRPARILVVEDDFVSRKLIQKLMTEYGTCDMAANGQEGIDAFIAAHAEKAPYDLVCLDIMMPVMDGQEVLRRLRNHEDQLGIRGLDGAKVLMITALDDFKNIMTAFREQCEGYLVKPVEKAKVDAQMADLGFKPLAA